MCAALYLELLVAAIFGGKKAGMAQLPGGATEGRETYRYAASSYRAKSNEGELRKEDSGNQTLCQGYGLQDLRARQGVNRRLTLFYDSYFLFYLGLTYISQYYNKHLGLVGRVLSRSQTLSGDGEEWSLQLGSYQTWAFPLLQTEL